MEEVGTKVVGCLVMERADIMAEVCLAMGDVVSLAEICLETVPAITMAGDSLGSASCRTVPIRGTIPLMT